MKSLLEKILASMLLLVSLPVILIAIVFVVMVDFNKPFFTQTRLGKSKNPFKLYKIRSMKNQEVTLVGKFLRKTGIDELPQLLNIILGQMSFVGPRPLTQNDVNRLEWNTDYYDVRWNLKPGIVGLAQLSPICHKKMSWFLDKNYIENQCFKLDARIMLSSILIPIVGKPQMKKWIHKR